MFMLEHNNYQISHTPLCRQSATLLPNEEAEDGGAAIGFILNQ